MGNEKGLSIEKIAELAFVATKKYISKEPETVLSVKEEEGGWKVTVEALERKAVPDTQDILGRYEIRFNEDGEVIGWEQRVVRKRSDRMYPAEEEWTIA